MMKACDDETGNRNRVRANTEVERADGECDEEWSKAPSLGQVFFVPSLGEIFAQEHGGSRHSRYDEAPKRHLAGSSQEAGGDTSQGRGLDDASFGGRDANPSTWLGEVRDKREEAQAGGAATEELALASPSYGEVVEEGRQASAAVQGAGPAFAREHVEELAFRSIYGDMSHSRSTQQPLAQSIEQIKHLDRVLGDGETRQLMIYSSIYGDSNSSPLLPSKSSAQQRHAGSVEWDMA